MVDFITNYDPEDRDVPKPDDDGTGTGPSSPSTSSNSRHEEFILPTLKSASESKADLFGVAFEKKKHAEWFGPQMLADERAKGNLENRTMQAILQTALSEMRIHELESDMQKLREDYYGEKVHRRYQKVEKQRVFQHVLHRSTPNQFRITSRSNELPILERPSLEVLKSEHAHPNDTYETLQIPPIRRTTGLDTSPPGPRTPERLRIRYIPLLSHLQRITRTNIKDVGPPNGDDEEPQSATVFLRPFKLFVIYENVIRQSFTELQAVAKSSGHVDSNSHAKNFKKPWDDGSFDVEDLLQDLKLLVDFITIDLRPTFDLIRDIENGTAETIEYVDLWHLFKRGDIIISQSNKSQLYRVINCAGGRERLIDRINDNKDDQPIPVDGFTIDCMSIAYDGSRYVPKLEKFSIRSYLDYRRIDSLPVYPLRFDSDPKGLRESFIKQGQDFIALTGPSFSHKTLNGKTLDEPPHDISAQVIVDMSVALNNKPHLRPSQNISEEDLTKGDIRETLMPPHCEHRLSRYDEGHCGSDIIFKDLEMDEVDLSDYVRANGLILAPRKAGELSEEDLMLLPNWVYAFVLRSRRWVKLRVANLSEVSFNNDFNSLLLSQKHKDTIRAMVKTHEKTRMSPQIERTSVGSGIDIVKGKGTGLIFLLHGEPGVGKTSTAECVADETERPLFPITCGDIGETAMEVETNLHINFGLAHKWGCVLLLDEADVFLARRNKADLRRNAVVSVFLRSLEYYSGVLFLTTNRVGSIDPAFKSRIHMSLYYKTFDIDDTRRLYEVFINRAQDEQKQNNSFLFKIKGKEILKFAERHFKQLEREKIGTWNGRQIRNAFQTAIALAEHEAQQRKEGDPVPRLGKAQFQTVAESSKEFEKYLIATLKQTESEMAMREEWRTDRFQSMEPIQTLNPSPSRPTYRQAELVRHSAKDPESESDTETDSDEDEDSDEDGGSKFKRASGKATASASKKAENPAEDEDMKEFEEMFQLYKKTKNRK